MRIVIVEDNRTNLLILTRIAGLIEGVDAVPFDESPRALDFILQSGCDLVLVDYLMPSLNGIGFIEQLRASATAADVPVIMITCEYDRAVRQAAIEAGATDFLTKPVDPFEIKARVKNLLALRKSALDERRRSEALARAVADATATVVAREKEMVLRIARAIECRDGDTGAHVERIASRAKAMAEVLHLNTTAVDELYIAAPMHDVGKIAVPDAILMKPGALTPDEWRTMQRHTIHGHAILCGSQVPLLRRAADIALSHHEHFDGRGYPNGLKGNDITIDARIVAVADVFDALISQRPYKAPWSIERAEAYLREKSGTQFDPLCVQAFFKSAAAFTQAYDGVVMDPAA